MTTYSLRETSLKKEGDAYLTALSSERAAKGFHSNIPRACNGRVEKISCNTATHYWIACTYTENKEISKEKTSMCLGIPGQIVEIVDDANSIAKVDVSGVKRNVSVALVRSEGIAPGEWVLIHVGFAMSKIDEQEAQETLQTLREMGDAYTDELKMLHSSQIE
jgi:hydrogenase expression/formation protein HypC